MLTLWNLVSRLRVYYWQMIFVKFIELFVFYKPDLGRYSAFLINQKMLSPLHHIQPTYNLEPNIYNLNHSINSHNLLTRLENTTFSNCTQRQMNLHKKIKKKSSPSCIIYTNNVICNLWLPPIYCLGYWQPNWSSRYHENGA